MQAKPGCRGGQPLCRRPMGRHQPCASSSCSMHGRRLQCCGYLHSFQERPCLQQWPNRAAEQRWTLRSLRCGVHRPSDWQVRPAGVYEYECACTPTTCLLCASKPVPACVPTTCSAHNSCDADKCAFVPTPTSCTAGALGQSRCSPSLATAAVAAASSLVS